MHNFILIANICHDMLKSANLKQKGNREENHVHHVLQLVGSVRIRCSLVERVKNWSEWLNEYQHEVKEEI